MSSVEATAPATEAPVAEVAKVEEAAPAPVVEAVEAPKAETAEVAKPAEEAAPATEAATEEVKPAEEAKEVAPTVSNEGGWEIHLAAGYSHSFLFSLFSYLCRPPRRRSVKLL